MSRQTNSMLLRYNINTFWSNSTNISRLHYIKEQLNFFFKIFLQNYHILPLKIQYNNEKIEIYTFFYKNEKYSFVYKNLLSNKIILNKSLYRKKYSILLLNIKNRNKKKLINNKVLKLVIKIIYAKFLFCTLKKKQLFFSYKNIFFLDFSHPYNKFAKKKNILKKNMFLSKKKRNRKKIRLKLLHFIIKNKWLSLFCSYILFFYSLKKKKIIITSSIKKLFSLVKFPFSFKYLKIENSRQKLYILLVGFFFFKSFVINHYIADIIKKTKNKKHIKNLILFFNFIKGFFQKQIIPLDGFKFRIAGRLNGKLRKGSFGFRIGNIKLMSLYVLVNYSDDCVITQYGSFSLKLWLCDNSLINNVK